MRALVFVDYYLPSFKAGGPVKSVSQLISRLSGEIEFFVFTRDRDLGDFEPFSQVPVDRWIEGNPSIFYASPAGLNLAGIMAAIRSVRPDVIYLNSYFSKLSRGVLLLKRLGMLGKIRITIGPRGEFSGGALAIKTPKKRLYLAFASLLGLHRGLLWQASAEHEAADIRRIISETVPVIVVAPDLTDANLPANVAPPVKRHGHADFAFLSRISPIKNLHRAIEFLSEVKGTAALTVYGPMQDPAYWQLCEGVIQTLPTNARVVYAGPVVPSDVVSTLAKHEFFLFPTQGENFGHVVAEALSAGLPTVISDRTPWLDLDENGVGWVAPLEDESLWRQAIQRCVDMDDPEYRMRRESASEYARRKAELSADLDANRRLFQFEAGP